MVESEAITNKDPMNLSVIFCNSEGRTFRNSIGRHWVEGGLLADSLLVWLHIPEHLARTGMENLSLQLCLHNCLHNVEHAFHIGIEIGMGHIERMMNVGHCSEIVELSGVYFGYESFYKRCVPDISIVKCNPWVVH